MAPQRFVFFSDLPLLDASEKLCSCRSGMFGGKSCQACFCTGRKMHGRGMAVSFFFGLGAAHSGIGIACETGQSREHEHPSMLISAAVKLIKTGCSGFGFYISFTSIWWEMVSQLSIRFGLGS